MRVAFAYVLNAARAVSGGVPPCPYSPLRHRLASLTPAGSGGHAWQSGDLAAAISEDGPVRALYRIARVRKLVRVPAARPPTAVIWF